MVCGTCGLDNVEGSRFCASCGSPLGVAPAATPGEPLLPAAPPAPSEPPPRDTADRNKLIAFVGGGILAVAVLVIVLTQVLGGDEEVDGQPLVRTGATATTGATGATGSTGADGPTAPQDVQVADATETGATLSWSPVAQSVESILVTRDGEVIATLTPDVVSFVDEEAPPASRIRYRVITVQAGVESPSEPITVETLEPPLREARVDGRYRVTHTITSSNLSNQQAGDTLRFTWKFAANCAQGACGGDWTIQVSSGPATGTFKVEGQGFSGRMSGVSLSVCNGNPGQRDRATMELQVEEARTIAGVWTGTELAGVFSEDFPAGGGCSSGSLDSLFGAKRRRA